MSQTSTFGVLTLPNEPWSSLTARWRRLEDGGVDALYSCDHFTNPYEPQQPWFEGWTSLTGLAAATTRVRVGLLVGAIVSRSPQMLVKQAQTVDHMTGGRLVIGLGAGGQPHDQAMWGVDEWSPADRAARFVEYVDMLEVLTREADVSYAGRWYRTTGALMTTGWVQRPRPPLLLAAHGAKTLSSVALHADIWNTYGPTLDDARRARERLWSQCEKIGRDPQTIRCSVLLGIIEGTSWTTPAQFEDVIAAWHAEGFRDFVFYDPPYARAGVPVAPASATDEILESSLPTLRAALA
jgi:alkanesulfonate monooxygenase SsuD/methylene tetrahydromethanopterin reductase-like flavin-dependent oxidoreductase (luciferase family)